MSAEGMPRVEEARPAIQYNVVVKASSDIAMQSGIKLLQGYKEFTRSPTGLAFSVFSEEELPYIGAVTVVKTIDSEAAQTAYKVLSKMEGLIVMPVHQSVLGDDAWIVPGLEALLSHKNGNGQGNGSYIHPPILPSRYRQGKPIQVA